MGIRYRYIDWEECDELLNDWRCARSSNATYSTATCEWCACGATNPSVGQSFACDVICIEYRHFKLEHAFHSEVQIALSNKVKRGNNREVVSYFLLHGNEVVAWLLIRNLAFHNQVGLDGVCSDIELDHHTCVSLVKRLWPCSKFGVVVGWLNALQA